MAKTILIVEDTPTLLENIVDSLQMEGYRTLTAIHGQEALDKLSENTPDLIITDLLMPVMDGITFIKKIKANIRWRNVPIIVFSAKVGEENTDNIQALGVTQLISKPCSLESLLLSVNKIIDE